MIDKIGFGVEPSEAARLLREAIADAMIAAEGMQATSVEIDHYE